MSQLLVIGDIHNKVALAENYISRFPGVPVIFLGDYFDDFGDDPFIARNTAEWLKQSLSKPNRIHLLGNHDFPYSVNGKVFCPGWTGEKNKAVNEVLTPEDWKQLKFFHYEKGYYFSHAGLRQHYYADPLTGEITPERLQKVLDQSIENLWGGLGFAAIWAVDAYRGGFGPNGSLLWLDWRGLKHIEGVNQIVGHTPAQKIVKTVNKNKNSIHYKVDTFLNEVLLLSDEKEPEIIKKFDFKIDKF